jgi:hypothetical protein
LDAINIKRIVDAIADKQKRMRLEEMVHDFGVT